MVGLKSIKDWYNVLEASESEVVSINTNTSLKK